MSNIIVLLRQGGMNEDAPRSLEELVWFRVVYLEMLGDMFEFLSPAEDATHSYIDVRRCPAANNQTYNMYQLPEHFREKHGLAKEYEFLFIHHGNWDKVMSKECHKNEIPAPVGLD